MLQQYPRVKSPDQQDASHICFNGWELAAATGGKPDADGNSSSALIAGDGSAGAAGASGSAAGAAAKQPQQRSKVKSAFQHCGLPMGETWVLQQDTCVKAPDQQDASHVWFNGDELAAATGGKADAAGTSSRALIAGGGSASAAGASGSAAGAAAKQPQQRSKVKSASQHSTGPFGSARVSQHLSGVKPAIQQALSQGAGGMAELVERGQHEATSCQSAKDVA